MPQLLIATTNNGKIREFRDLLAGCGWQLVTPRDVGLSLDVEETGNSYLENARLKAHAFCQASGLPALADDSGLEIDALGGAPGLYSARYAGPDTTHGDKMKQVLAALAGLPDAPRTARFRAVVVVAFPDSRELTAEGVCEGIIAETPRGAGGFGYDPVFLVEGGPLTMAELPAPQKNDISHRARAVHALRDALQRAADGYPSTAPTRQ